MLSITSGGPEGAQSTCSAVGDDEAPTHPHAHAHTHRPRWGVELKWCQVKFSWSPLQLQIARREGGCVKRGVSEP